MLSLLQAGLGHLDEPVLLACLDHPGGLDFLDLEVSQEVLGSRANLDSRERQERVVFPVDRADQVDLVREYFGSVNYLTVSIYVFIVLYCEFVGGLAVAYKPRDASYHS